MKNSEIINLSKKTLQIEIDALLKLERVFNENFTYIVQILSNCKGKLVLCGIGKSAHIAKKIVATLNSTGTQATFLHAAEAIHGDLGLVNKEDVCLVFSKSGNTPEIKTIVPLLKNKDATVIGISSNSNSFLYKNSDYNLLTEIEKEACINNLAPTTSTTLQLVLGDVLANCLQALQNFDSKDFAKSHPGGSLGKRLYLRVEDMVDKTHLPSVTTNAKINEVILSISESRHGTTVVLKNNKIEGIITDGDLRRMLTKYNDFSSLKAEDIMSSNPKKINQDSLASQALEVLECHNIGQLVVTNYKNEYIGILDIHSLIKEGIL